MDDKGKLLEQVFCLVEEQKRVLEGKLSEGIAHQYQERSERIKQLLTRISQDGFGR